MQYAVDLAQLFVDRGSEVVLVTNRLFGRGVFKQRRSDLSSIAFKPKLVRVLVQPAFFKKKHPYENLKRKKPGLGARIRRWFFKPGSIRPVLYFVFEDFRAGHFHNLLNLVAFMSRISNPIMLVPALLAAILGVMAWGFAKLPPGRLLGRLIARLDAWRERVVERQLSRLEATGSVQAIWGLFRRQSAGYLRMYQRVNPGPDDVVILPTAEQPDLVAIERLLAANPRWRTARHKLILRTPVWNREGSMGEPPEAAKLQRKALIDLVEVARNLELFADTEELVDQYRILGFANVRLLPILYGERLLNRMNAAALEVPEAVADRPLTVLRSGSAQREKGFLVMPDLLKAAQLASAAGGARLRFVIQSTMLRFQRRWDRLVATINRLHWFNRGDVKLIVSEVSTAQYEDTLMESDIVLSHNRSVPYMHGSTGTTIEAMLAGKPLVTMSENWGGRQLRNLDRYVDHIVEFSERTRIAGFGSDAFIPEPITFDQGWHDHGRIWDPFFNVLPEQLSFDVAQRFTSPVPPRATHVVAIARSTNVPRPGDLFKIGLQAVRSGDALERDRPREHVYQYLSPLRQAAVWRYFGAGREVTAAVWTLPEGTLRVHGGVVQLDRRATLDGVDIEIRICDNSASHLPISAVGLVADTPYEIAEGLGEIATHFVHYAETARMASSDLAGFHNRETFARAFIDGEVLPISGDTDSQ